MRAANNFAGWLKTTLTGGLLIVAPVAVTGWLLVKILLFLDSLLAHPVHWLLIKIGIELPPDRVLYGPGLIALLILLLLIGAVARWYIGRRAIEHANALIERIPVIKTIYSTLQPLSRAVFGDSSHLFKAVVWIPYEQGYSIAFVIGDAPVALCERVGKALTAVYLPLTASASGFILYYPPELLVPSPLKIEEAIKMVFSYGIVQTGRDSR